MIDRFELERTAIPIANISAPLEVISGIEAIKSGRIRNYKRKRDQIREAWNQESSDHDLDEVIRDLAILETEDQYYLYVEDLQRLIDSLEIGLCILFEKHREESADGPWTQQFVNKNYRYILDNFHYFKGSFYCVPFSAENYESKLKILKTSLEEMKASYKEFKSGLGRANHDIIRRRAE